MQKLFVLIMLLCGIHSLEAQNIARQVFSNGADFDSSGSITISSSIGQSLCFTLEANEYAITQGFQQENEVVSVNTVEPTVETSFSVYPNPTDQFFTIKLSSDGPFAGSIVIYNDLNQVVLRESVVTNHTHSKTYGKTVFPHGVYFISLIDRQGTVMNKQKLIITK